MTEAVGRDAVQRARHAYRRVEDEQVGDEVVLFDHLALLDARRRGYETGAPEPRPLRVAVEVALSTWLRLAVERLGARFQAAPPVSSSHVVIAAALSSRR